MEPSTHEIFYHEPGQRSIRLACINQIAIADPVEDYPSTTWRILIDIYAQGRPNRLIYDYATQGARDTAFAQLQRLLGCEEPGPIPTTDIDVLPPLK